MCLLHGCSGNEVAVRQTRLVPGWVTACKQVKHIYMYATSYPGQLSLLCSGGDTYLRGQ